MGCCLRCGRHWIPLPLTNRAGWLGANCPSATGRGMQAEVQ